MIRPSPRRSPEERFLPASGSRHRLALAYTVDRRTQSAKLFSVLCLSPATGAAIASIKAAQIVAPAAVEPLDRVAHNSALVPPVLLAAAHGDTANSVNVDVEVLHFDGAFSAAHHLLGPAGKFLGGAVFLSGAQHAHRVGAEHPALGIARPAKPLVVERFDQHWSLDQSGAHVLDGNYLKPPPEKFLGLRASHVKFEGGEDRLLHQTAAD